MVACYGLPDLRDYVAHHYPFLRGYRHDLHLVSHIVDRLDNRKRDHYGFGLPSSEADDTVLVVVNPDNLVICRTDLDPCPARVHSLGIKVFVNLLSDHADLAFLRHVHLVDVAAIDYRGCLYPSEICFQPFDVAP